MPIQVPQWTDYLSCPVCENGFDLLARLPVSLGCGHSICKTCLANLQRAVCPFDQGIITLSLSDLPVNTALILLIDGLDCDLEPFRPSSSGTSVIPSQFKTCMLRMEKLASLLRPKSNGQPQLSRPMQRKLVTLINCQILEEEGRSRANRAARSLGERSVTELILQHQNPQQLSANLWAAVRARGCQFLGPAMQEEVLKLVLLALEDGSALSRKVLVMFVVQRLEPHFPQASKTSIGHVVQLLYRASCFKVTKRDADSSLMQLKEEFRTYETLRREHDAQIVQIATEAGLRIAPDQWSSLLYGDTAHKSHMQSIIDKLQTPQSFLQSVQELVIALQRTGDPGNLGALRPHLDSLALIDPSPDTNCSDWETLAVSLKAVYEIVSGLLTFIEHHIQTRRPAGDASLGASGQMNNSRYKTSMCRDLTMHGSCPRGRNCTFAHSQTEIELYRNNRKGRFNTYAKPGTLDDHKTILKDEEPMPFPPIGLGNAPAAGPSGSLLPVAQVAPLPRGFMPPVAPLEVNHLGQPIAPLITPVDMPVQTPILGTPIDVNLVPSPMDLPFGGNPSPSTPIAPSAPAVMGVYNQRPAEMLEIDSTVCQMMSAGDPAAAAAAMGMAHYSTGQQNGDTDANGQRFYRRDERTNQQCYKEPSGHATKSLSALLSRKEEIIDHLEDLVGKEEARLITNRAAEHSVSFPMSRSSSSAMVSVTASASASSNNAYYSIWTSRSIATIPTSSAAQNEASNSHHTGESEQWWKPRDDEDIPFSDVPLVCRFGPISRKCATYLQEATPSQTQAVISDEPTPTAVVRHSKQMARPAPSAIYHQNGARTTLQPVAVGVNGEVGFIAVQEPVIAATPPSIPTPQDAMFLQQIQQNSALRQQSSVDMTTTEPSSSSALYAESERMKLELDILQKKIADLNMAHLAAESSNEARQVEQYVTEKEELAKELHVIETTIRDREREICVNHMNMSDWKEDCRLRRPIVSQSQLGHESRSGIMTTATSGLSCSKSKGRPQQFNSR